MIVSGPSKTTPESQCCAHTEALPVEGTNRNVLSRTLVYDQSHRRVVAACEDGKLAGEAARGTAVVRSGDLALAHVLETWVR